MFKKVQKRSVTLLEIMIVIFLIALIGGAVAYNMRGSLDQGKRFKTEQAQNQIRDILLLQLSESGGSVDGKLIASQAVGYLEKSGLVKDPKNFVKDGWGETMKVEYVNHDFRITSKNLEKYLADKKELVSEYADAENSADY